MECIELLEELNRKYDELYQDMRKMANLIADMYGKISFETQTPREVLAPDTGSMYQAWKSSIRSKAKLLVENGDFESVEDCFKEVYAKMTNVYGVCWAQERTDYREKYNSMGQIHNIDIIWDKEMLRSIFNSIIAGMVQKIPEVVEEEPEVLPEGGRYGSCDAIIRPLIVRNNDSSRYGCATFHRVYAQMNRMGDINWERAERRYINKYGSTGMSRKLVIESSPTLMKKFKESVNVIMKGECEDYEQGGASVVCTEG